LAFKVQTPLNHPKESITTFRKWRKFEIKKNKKHGVLMTLVSHNNLQKKNSYVHDKRVPVTRAWWVLSLRIQERPPIRSVAANILYKEYRTADKGWFLSWGFGGVLTIPHSKTYQVTDRSHRPRPRTVYLLWNKQQKRSMNFRTWNVTSQYRVSSLTAAARELATCNAETCRSYHT
jgi:hypothetical protein